MLWDVTSQGGGEEAILHPCISRYFFSSNALCLPHPTFPKFLSCMGRVTREARFSALTLHGHFLTTASRTLMLTAMENGLAAASPDQGQRQAALKLQSPSGLDRLP